MELLPQISSPFTGREKELSVLLELHRLRKNVLIVGSPGVGKSALVRQVKVRLPLLLIQRPKRLKDLYSSLGSQIQLEQTQLIVSELRNNLLSTIEATGEPVVFDSVADAPKAVAKFIVDVSRTVPVWIVCRSDLPHEIGRISEKLADYVRLSLSPLKLTEVRSHIAQAVQSSRLRKDALAHVSTVYSLCRGNPQILIGLLSELSKPEHKNKESFQSHLQRLKRFANRINSELSDSSDSK